MTTALQRFRAALGEADDLNRAAAVLEWDLETYMPPGGVEDRAQHLSTLRKLGHERFVSEDMRRLLEAAEAEVEAGRCAYETDEASRNNVLIGLISSGEGWHNNHHADPRSARHGHRWWELDVTWLTIRLLMALGLAKNVATPSPHLAPHAADRLPTRGFDVLPRE